jgi:ubiquinone/menaquinone biosynthesis C-methylase UbiE
MVNNSYDRVAGYYDFLKRVVFGHAIINSQMSLLKFIRPNSNILIVGGGTGEILEKIAGLYASGIEITYVEISEKMIDISRQRNVGNNEIKFIPKPVEEFVPAVMYDAIITPFLFDNFKAEKIEAVIQQLDPYLSPNGYWLYADFNADRTKQPLWQKASLKCMYMFFRWISHIEADKLVDAKLFLEERYTRISETRLYAGFIRSYAFKKPQ